MLPLSAYLPSASLPPAQPAAAAEPAAPDAVSWFSAADGDGSRVLRAPGAATAHTDATLLAQRFMACLCDSGT